MFIAKQEEKCRFLIRAEKSPERESGSERRTVDGHPKQQTEGPELHRAGDGASVFFSNKSGWDEMIFPSL